MANSRVTAFLIVHNKVTKQVTLWNWVLFETLIVVTQQSIDNSQPIFLLFFGTRRFITTFTRPYILSQIHTVHTLVSYFKRAMIILSCNLCLIIPSDLFYHHIQSKILEAFLLPPASLPLRANASIIHPSTFGTIWHLVHIMELHILPLTSAAT
jgi:hypothetical protein